MNSHLFINERSVKVCLFDFYRSYDYKNGHQNKSKTSKNGYFEPSLRHIQ